MRDSSGFKDLVARDTLLPELASVLDETRVARQLGINPSSVQLDYIRYKPGTNCLARFSTGHASVPFVYAKTFTATDWVKIANAPLKVTLGCDVPVEYQDACVLYKFPTDAKLNSLSKLALQPSWLRERFGLSNPSLPMDVFAYKPERRCVLKLREPGAAYILKLFSKHAFESALSATRFAKSLPVESPKVLKKSRRHHALLFEFIDGPTLRDEIVASRGALGCAIAGKLLAGFHDASVSPGRSIMPEPANHGLLTWLLPETTNQIHDIVTEAVAVIQQTRATNVTLHGDFYDKQIILATNGTPVLLDLDELGQGDHRIDMATFIAHLESANPSSSSVLLDIFLSAYTTFSSNATKALHAYVALSTLQLAHHGFRRGSKDWRTQTLTSINRAQQWLDRAGEF